MWKLIAKPAESMMTSHGFASTVIANIVHTLRGQSVVVSFGREKKMENKEA